MFSHKPASPDGMLIMMDFVKVISTITHVKHVASQNQIFTVIFMSCWSLYMGMNKIHYGV